MNNNDFHPPSTDPQSAQTQPIEPANFNQGNQSNQPNHNAQSHDASSFDGTQTARYATPHDGSAQYGAFQYDSSPYGAPQYGASQYGASQYGAPQGAMLPSGYPANYDAAYRPWNGWAIAGFVSSFFAGIIGIVLSIIGLVQTGKRNERGRGLSIAGIVIGAISTLLSLLLIIGITAAVMRYGVENGGWNVGYSWDFGDSSNPGSSGQRDSSTQDGNGMNGDLDNFTDSNVQGDSGTSLSPGVILNPEYVEDVADDIEGSVDDSMDDIHARNTSVNTLDDLVSSDAFIARATKEAAELSLYGVAMKYSVAGDTITYQYAVDDSYTEYTSVFERELSDYDNDMQSTINQIGRVCTTTEKLNLRLHIISESGTTIFDRTYTER